MRSRFAVAKRAARPWLAASPAGAVSLRLSSLPRIMRRHGAHARSRFARWARGDLVRNIFRVNAKNFTTLPRRPACSRVPRLRPSSLPTPHKNIVTRRHASGSLLLWARGDLNSQALRHTLLKRTCIPFHHVPVRAMIAVMGRFC